MSTNDGLGIARLDELFQHARSGDNEAFAGWMGLVEIPLRGSLRRFARAVDVEVVAQETLMRMWLMARDPGRILEGNHASLKFAFRVARNVALEEMRRNRLDMFVDMEGLEDDSRLCFEPEPSDPALARAIKECMDSLTGKPRKALAARLDGDPLPDREIAAGLRMRLNTFLQNVVRARNGLRECLKRRGVSLGEVRA